MRLWLAFLIVFLLTCTVQSDKKRSPKKKFNGETTTTTSTPYPPTTKDNSCICTLEYNPVCGSDGVTYGNPCALACAQKQDPDLEKAHDGECEDQCPAVPKDSVGCVCTEEYKPVCGSDRKTYGNFCEFCCAQRANPYLTKAHDGECEEQCPPAPEESTDCICTDEYDPVCGTDKRTYGNFCMFCCAQRANPYLGKAHDGECVRECPAHNPSTGCACTKEYKPVCGSDMKTYGNMCTFCCEQNNNPYLELAHVGACDQN